MVHNFFLSLVWEIIFKVFFFGGGRTGTPLNAKYEAQRFEVLNPNIKFSNILFFFYIRLLLIHE